MRLFWQLCPFLDKDLKVKGLMTKLASIHSSTATLVYWKTASAKTESCSGPPKPHCGTFAFDLEAWCASFTFNSGSSFTPASCSYFGVHSDQARRPRLDSGFWNSSNSGVAASWQQSLKVNVDPPGPRTDRDVAIVRLLDFGRGAANHVSAALWYVSSSW